MSEQRVTTLPPSGLQLHINNKFLPLNITDPLNFPVPQLINFTGGQHTTERQLRIFVHNVLFRNFIPTIRSRVNDQFYYNLNGVDYIDTFASGVYNINTLINSLTTALTAKGLGAFVLSYNTDQYLLTITPPIGCTMTITSISQASSYYNSKEYPPAYRFLELVGLVPNQGLSYTNANPCVGLNAVNLLSCDFMKINLDNQDVQVVNTNPRNPQTICTIPIAGAPYGSLIQYEPNLPVTLSISPAMVENLSIRCTDEHGTDLKGLPQMATLEIHMMIIPLN